MHRSLKNTDTTQSASANACPRRPFDEHRIYSTILPVLQVLFVFKMHPAVFCTPSRAIMSIKVPRIDRGRRGRVGASAFGSALAATRTRNSHRTAAMAKDLLLLATLGCVLVLTASSPIAPPPPPPADCDGPTGLLATSLKVSTAPIERKSRRARAVHRNLHRHARAASR
jgi:hypothetical protein